MINPNDDVMLRGCDDEFSPAEDLKQLEEDHDDVDVEDEGTHNVVIDGKLMTLAANDQLRINDQEKTVQDNAESGRKGHPRFGVVEDEHGDDREHELNGDDDDEGEDCPATAQLGEISFREARVERQRDGDDGGVECC